MKDARADRMPCWQNAPASVQYLDREEEQQCQPQRYCVGAVVRLAGQHRPVPLDVLGAMLIKTAMEVLPEVLHAADIGADGCLVEDVPPQPFNHERT